MRRPSPDMARQILDSDTYQEALARAETRIMEEWKTTPVAATEAREKLYFERAALDRITRELRGIRDQDKLTPKKREESDGEARTG